jgi:hypothetical protein
MTQLTALSTVAVTVGTAERLRPAAWLAALLWLAAPALAQTEARQGLVWGWNEAKCSRTATISVARTDRVITLEEGNQIKREVEKYFAEAKPTLEPGVPPPGEVYANCQGRMWLGGWLLESAFSDQPELNLSFRVLTNEHFIVRQVVLLREVEGRWQVVRVGRVTAHLRPR